jgi:hypothetical protein
LISKNAPPRGAGSYTHFKDTKRAAAEEVGYLANSEKKHNFDPAKYAQKIETFGVIVFESDQDLPGKTVYLCYDDRW